MKLLGLLLLGYVAWSFWRGIFPKRNTKYLIAWLQNNRWEISGETFWWLPIPLFYPFNRGKFTLRIPKLKEGKIEWVELEMTSIPITAPYPFAFPLTFIQALGLGELNTTPLFTVKVTDLIKLTTKTTDPFGKLQEEILEAADIWSTTKDLEWAVKKNSAPVDDKIVVHNTILTEIIGTKVDSGKEIKIGNTDIIEYLNTKKAKPFSEIGLEIEEISLKIPVPESAKNILAIKEKQKVQEEQIELQKGLQAEELAKTTGDVARQVLILTQAEKNWKLEKEKVETYSLGQAIVNEGWSRGNINTLILNKEEGNIASLVTASTVSKSIQESTKTKTA